jgi:hypothetical protein
MFSKPVRWLPGVMMACELVSQAIFVLRRCCKIWIYAKRFQAVFRKLIPFPIGWQDIAFLLQLLNPSTSQPPFILNRYNFICGNQYVVSDQ